MIHSIMGGNTTTIAEERDAAQREVSELQLRIQGIAAERDAIQYELAELRQAVRKHAKLQRRIREASAKEEAARREAAKLQQRIRDAAAGKDAAQREAAQLYRHIQKTSAEEETARREAAQPKQTVWEQDEQATAPAGLQQSETANSTATAAPDQSLAPNKPLRYSQLVRQIREVVNDVVPAAATVAVVSKGDEELLKLGDGRKGWHFPQDEHGAYAGYHPADSSQAIAHLEELRAKGAQFLLFPGTALWWLEHYAEFREHLDTQYRVIVSREDTCLVFALRGTEKDGSQLINKGERLRNGQLVRQIQEVVRSILPLDATVVVVGEGDEELLKLGDGRKGWHFPQDEHGAYAGYHPADSSQAIAHLEELRAKGAQFLLFPETSFWWLEHYAEFREHLDTQYRVIVRQRHVCRIYQLSELELGKTEAR
jgi:hypothetical protein